MARASIARSRKSTRARPTREGGRGDRNLVNKIPPTITTPQFPAPRVVIPPPRRHTQARKIDNVRRARHIHRDVAKRRHDGISCPVKGLNRYYDSPCLPLPPPCSPPSLEHRGNTFEHWDGLVNFSERHPRPQFFIPGLRLVSHISFFSFCFLLESRKFSSPSPRLPVAISCSLFASERNHYYVTCV